MTTSKRTPRKRPTNRREKITSLLAGRILRGDYPEGERMPTENMLTEELKISRTVLREASRTLAAKGLLRARARDGTRVCPRRQWNLLDADVLNWMEDTPNDILFILSLQELRMFIEPGAAILAARRAGATEVEDIEQALKKMEALEWKNLQACVEADIEFHRAVLDAAGNPALSSLGSLITAALRALFRLSFAAMESGRETQDLHRDLFEAIRRHDETAAEQTMQTIILTATRNLNIMLESDTQPDSLAESGKSPHER